MERDLEDLINEGKEFHRLHSIYNRKSQPEAGTECYLISIKWLDKYRKYICYDDIKMNSKPQVSEKHCETYYPGPISNLEDLGKVDDNYLKDGD